jgi:glutathione S-transferase
LVDDCQTRLLASVWLPILSKAGIPVTSLPILYSFRRCPYAMRARMALIATETQVEHREILLRDKPSAMLAVSPKGTVPVLVLPNGAVIDESLDIMRWALTARDPLGWGNGDRALIEANDGPFKYHLDRMKYAHRYEGADPAEHRAEALLLLEPWDAELSTMTYLRGDTATVTDIAIFPFIRQFARADMTKWAAEPLPNLRRWLDILTSSALFEAAMIKHPVWTASDAGSKEAA